MKRRSFIKALPFAGAAAIAPGQVQAIEGPWGKADRLAWELAGALQQVESGNWKAQVYGDGRSMPVVFQNTLVKRSDDPEPKPQTPEQRLRSAYAEIQKAIGEMGVEEYVLVMREDGSGVAPFILEFEQGTGTTRRKIELT